MKKNKKRKQPLVQKAHDLIKEKIITLELKPGAKLEEKDLVAITGLGRTPIREAVKMLISEGLIKNYGSNSIYVKDFSVKSSKDLMAILYHMGNIISDLAGLSGEFSSDLIADLEGLCREMDEDIMKGHYLEFIKHNSLFHKKFAKIANNEYLDSFIDSLYNEEVRLSFILSVERADLLPLRRQYEKVQGQHKELVELVKRKDFPSLKTTYQAHIIEGQKRLIGYFSQ